MKAIRKRYCAGMKIVWSVFTGMKTDTFESVDWDNVLCGCVNSNKLLLSMLHASKSPKCRVTRLRTEIDQSVLRFFASIFQV